MRERVVHFVKDRASNVTACFRYTKHTWRNGALIKIENPPIVSCRWGKVTCKRCLARVKK